MSTTDALRESLRRICLVMPPELGALRPPAWQERIQHVLTDQQTGFAYTQPLKGGDARAKV